MAKKKSGRVQVKAHTRSRPKRSGPKNRRRKTSRQGNLFG